MQYSVVLGRDSWTRSRQRSYRSLSRVSNVTPLFGELDLRTDDVGPAAFSHNRSSSDNACFHLVYAGQEDAVISDELQTLPVNILRRTGHPAPTGNCLVTTLPQSGIVAYISEYLFPTAVKSRPSLALE